MDHGTSDGGPFDHTESHHHENQGQNQDVASSSAMSPGHGLEGPDGLGITERAVDKYGRQNERLFEDTDVLVMEGGESQENLQRRAASTHTGIKRKADGQGLDDQKGRRDQIVGTIEMGEDGDSDKEPYFLTHDRIDRLLDDYHPRGIIQGTYKPDTAPRRVVIATFDVGGVLVRYMTNVNVAGGFHDSSLGAGPAVNVGRSEVIWISGWGNALEEGPRLFKELCDKGISHGWGWRSYEHMLKEPGLRARKEQLKKKEYDDYAIDNILNTTPTEENADRVIAAVRMFINDLRVFGRQLNTESLLMGHHATDKWPEEVKFANDATLVGVLMQKCVDHLQMRLWDMAEQLSRGELAEDA